MSGFKLRYRRCCRNHSAGERARIGDDYLDEKQFVAAMEHIVAALDERGYEPYAQLTGYVTENEPTYITSYKGARQLIVTLDMDQVKRFVREMKQ